MILYTRPDGSTIVFDKKIDGEIYAHIERDGVKFESKKLAQLVARGYWTSVDNQSIKSFKSAKELLDFIGKYSPDQERDDHGRFGSGSGGGDSKPNSHGGYELKDPANKQSTTASTEAQQLAESKRNDGLKSEPAITKNMIDLANANGATMVGLDFRLKSEDSLARKIDADAKNEFDGDKEKAAENIGDSLRYTMQYSADSYSERVASTLKDLEEQGYEMRVKNYWQEGNAYKGINVAVTAGDGTIFELQFHTPQSFDIKENEAHLLYEKYRVETDPEIRTSLDAQMREVGAKVITPDNPELLATIGKPKFD